MTDIIGELRDMMFHIAIYLGLWRIISELVDIKKGLKEKDGDTNG